MNALDELRPAEVLYFLAKIKKQTFRENHAAKLVLMYLAQQDHLKIRPNAKQTDVDFYTTEKDTAALRDYEKSVLWAVGDNDPVGIIDIYYFANIEEAVAGEGYLKDTYRKKRFLGIPTGNFKHIYQLNNWGEQATGAIPKLEADIDDASNVGNLDPQLMMLSYAFRDKPWSRYFAKFDSSLEEIAKKAQLTLNLASNRQYREDLDATGSSY